ncbi:oxygen-independent coproporphyrinogen-3 oxidase [Melaminivora alkalimesophila]|uniref:Heme chaperone HemW n=3 Tax=Melaminivora alkalimesophila TaxID=1165852 RepID=A0A317REV1_9BURK|nr:radical SAM family heme chaperone HemW [Melaminivora alkalimesophila]PWW48702.1 oxygen-independent coproporphyrinogen-3 oxidase [Melaminivora alkalimesophila]
MSIPIHPDPGPAPAPARDALHYLRPGLLQLTSLPPLSLYIHIPWCLRKCPYCDFNSHEARAGVEGLPEQRYVDALIADLETALPLVWGRTVHSVFIGGGTPSLFAPESIDRLLAAVRARLPLEADGEVTLEANPGTFERERFRAYRAAGVTRLSIGVQSFHDRHLQALGRVHDRAQALAAAEEASEAFETFNLDLMYALPGQSLAELEEDLRLALGFGPPHLSIYHLTIEPNTWFARHPPQGLPEDDEAYAMLDRIGELTEAAQLQRYEVSAFARSGHASVHNRNYWQFGDYLGIGAGAHGKLSFAHRIVRQVRLRDPQRYMDAALAGNAIAQEHDVRRADLPFEFMLNALRLREGFALADFTARTGLAVTAIEQGLREAESRGLVERDMERVWPTARGLDFLSDLQALFLPD